MKSKISEKLDPAIMAVMDNVGVSLGDNYADRARFFMYRASFPLQEVSAWDWSGIYDRLCTQQMNRLPEPLRTVRDFQGSHQHLLGINPHDPEQVVVYHYLETRYPMKPHTLKGLVPTGSTEMFFKHTGKLSPTSPQYVPMLAQGGPKTPRWP